MKPKTFLITLTITSSVIAIISTLVAVSYATEVGAAKRQAAANYQKSLEARVAAKTATEAQAAATEAAETADQIAARERQEATLARQRAKAMEEASREAVKAMRTRMEALEATAAADAETLAKWEADLTRREEALRSDYAEMTRWRTHLEAVAAQQALASQQPARTVPTWQFTVPTAAGSTGPEINDYARRIAEAAEARNLEMQLLNAQMSQWRAAAELE